MRNTFMRIMEVGDNKNKAKNHVNSFLLFALSYTLRIMAFRIFYEDF